VIASDENLQCPACRKAVFTDPVVMRCLQCGEFQHDSCAGKGSRCGVSATCKGKTERCVVVRVPHAGPTKNEISESIDALVQKALAPLATKLDAQAQTLADQHKVGVAADESAQQELTTLRARSDTALGALEKALQTVLRVTRDIDKRTLYQQKPLSQKQLEESIATIAERIEESTAAEGERLDTRLALLRAQLVPDLRGAVRAIEACRFDVVAARHPAPWETGVQDVLAPVASTDLPREELS